MRTVSALVYLKEAVKMMILNSLEIDCFWRVLYRAELTESAEEG